MIRRSYARFEPEQGIAIGPVLFVIALLAVLAAAIAAGSGTFTGGTGQETARTQASTFLQYADLIKSAVQRVQIENQCNPAQITFSNPVSTAWFGVDPYANSSAPADGSCSIFSVNGGGVQYHAFPSNWYAIPPHDNFEDQAYYVGLVQNVGSGATGVMLWIGGITGATCREVNKLLGITSDLSGPGAATATNFFNGDFDQDPMYVQYDFAGHPEGCYSYDGSPNGDFNFYSMLLIR